MVSFEEGLYLVRAVNNGLSETKSGNPQIVIQVKVIGKYPDNRPDAEAEPVDRELTRTIYMPLTEKTIERTAEDLVALGVVTDLSPEEVMNRASDNYVSLADKTFKAYCSHSEYNGNVNEKWQIRERSFFSKPSDDALLKLEALRQKWQEVMSRAGAGKFSGKKVKK